MIVIKISKRKAARSEYSLRQVEATFHIAWLVADRKGFASLQRKKLFNLP